MAEREAPSAGRGHRRPAGKEFRAFLSQFVLVVTVGEAYTSQPCTRCGGHLEFTRFKKEKRSECCNSAGCQAGVQERRAVAQARRNNATPDTVAAQVAQVADEPAVRQHPRTMTAPDDTLMVDRDTTAGIMFYHILDARRLRAHRADLGPQPRP